MKQKDINRLIDETISSIDSIDSALPGDNLFPGIMNSVNQKEKGFLNENNPAGKYVLAMIIIILLNLVSVITLQKSTENTSISVTSDKTNELKEFAKEYFNDQSEYNYNRK